MYRLLMNIIYKGNYYKRFDKITALITGKNVTELCFGDTIIANYCKQNAIAWVGIDANKKFVQSAIEKKFNANFGNIEILEKFPASDTLIMCGSLYHFHQNLENLFLKMFTSSSQIIISEPVINLSSRNGFIGKLARVSASINGQKHSFRYTEQTLIKELDKLKNKIKFDYKIIVRFNKDLILLIQK